MSINSEEDIKNINLCKYDDENKKIIVTGASGGMVIL